jgi:hypothetical protein
MKDTQPILTLAMECDSALDLIKLCLIEKGLYARHDFELTSSCASFTDPVCPHRPDQVCNCQLVTLQVYGSGTPAFPLVFHGYDVCTEIFYMAEDSLSPDVLSAIKEAKLNERQFNQIQNNP